MAVSHPVQHAPWWRFALGRLRALLGDPIPTQTLAFFFDRFATLLDAGIPVHEALRQAAPVDDPELAQICAAVERPLCAGVPLHRALLSWNDRLPPIVLPILEVGEVSGTLDGAAKRLADAFGQVASLERRYHTAIFHPGLVILGLSLYMASTQLSDSLLQMLTVLASTFVQLGLLYIVGRLLLRLLWRWEGLRYALDTLKLALPAMGTVARNLAAARWARSFATLWNSGVPVSTSLEISARSALNACYERALRQAARQTRAGRTLADSLQGTQLLPTYLLEIIRTGETSGSLGIALEQFAGLLEAEAFTKSTQQFVFIVSVGKLLLTIAAVVSILH